MGTYERQAHCTSGVQGDYDDNGMTNGLDIQPFVRCYLGGSATTAPCDCADPRTQASVVAAARLGRGRIVTFGHTGYLDSVVFGVADTGRLLTNVIHWSAKGGDNRPPSSSRPAKESALRVGVIDNAGLADSLHQKGFASRSLSCRKLLQRLNQFDVICLGQAPLEERQMEAIRGFVRSGHGLIMAGLGWGWLQLNPNRSLDDHPRTFHSTATMLLERSHPVARRNGAVTEACRSESRDADGRLLSTEARILARVLARIGMPPVRVRLWTDEELAPAPGEPDLTLQFRERLAPWRLLLDPYRCLGDAYSDGRLEIQGDLVSLLEAIYRREHPARRLSHRLLRRNHNTPSESQSNIHRHYDLSNEFYRLWLDEQLVYTCAYFQTDGMSLDEAQVAKMDYVCRKIRLSPGERVVEAGCGWGALALHMARRYDVSVRSFNISGEQIAYARERLRREGLEGRVEYVEDDYRNITGQYDAFVSVGMLEHVGAQNYGELGAVIDRCLTPSGRGLIHTVGRHRPLPFNRWMDTRIFPGAYIPALSEIMTLLEPRDFAVMDVENLRLHYALTLRHWLARFEAEAPRIVGMFDEEFVRMWRLYLAGSIAAFTTGWTQLYQVVFNRFQNNAVPWTRAYLYAEPGNPSCRDTT